MNQNIEFKAIPGQFNIDEAQGIVECFVAGIGNKDSVGDVLVSGAFSKSLTRRKPRVVWGHNWNDPIGKVLEIYEVAPGDRRLPMKMLNAGIGGLYARVQFNLNSEKGREAFANVAFFGQEQEWSIGYKTLDSIFDPNLQANILKEVELYEVSPVLHGANQLTGTISVKSDEMVDDAKGGIMAIGMTRPMGGGPNVPHRHHRSTPNILEANKPGIGDERKNQLEIELALRAGAPVKVRVAEENSVIFDRMTPDGAPTTYRVSYHFTGREFMFGKPEKVSVQTVYVPSSEESGSRVVIPSQMPSMPMQVKPQGNAYLGDDQGEYQRIMPKSYDDGEKWVFDDELADLANIISDSLDVKVGRALSGKNMSRLKAILENLQEVIASAEKDVESKSDYVIPVAIENAFETKQLLDPIFDYHRVESHVTEDGIVVTSGVTEEFVEAIGVAEKALGRRLGGGLGKLGRAARGAANFDPNAWDGDGDGLVQEGTPYQRPAIPGVNDRSTGGRVDAAAATRAFRQAGGRVRENAKARRDEKRRGGLASTSDKPEPIKDEGRLYTWPVYEELNGEFVQGEVVALSDLYGDESVPGFGVVGIYDQDGSGEPGYFYGGDDEEFDTVEDALGFLQNIEKQGAKGKFYDDPNFKKFKPAKKQKREGLASTSYPASWQLPGSEDGKGGIRVLDSQVLSDRMAGLSLDDAAEKFGIPKEKLRKMEAREMARIREEMNPKDFVAYRMMGMSLDDLSEITGKTPAELRQIEAKEMAKMRKDPSDTDLLQYRERGMSLDDLSEITGLKREEIRKRELKAWNAKPEIPEPDKPLNEAQMRQMAEDEKKKRRGGLASTSVEKKPEVLRGEIVGGPGSKTPAKKYIERRVENGWINPSHQDALDEVLADVTPESISSENAGDVLSDVRRNLLRAINEGKFDDYRGAEMREDSLKDYLTQQIAGAVEDAITESINENIKKVQDARRKKLLEEGRDELVSEWSNSLVDSIKKIRSVDAPSDEKIARAKKRATESRSDLVGELTDGSPEYDADSFWYSVGEILRDDPTIDSEDFLKELQDAASKGIKENPDNEFMQAIQDELDADDNRFRSLVEAMEDEKLESDYIPEKVASKRTLARGLASTSDRRMRDEDNFDEYDEAFGPSVGGSRRGMADDPVGDAAAENIDRDRNAQAVRRGLASTRGEGSMLARDGQIRRDEQGNVDPTEAREARAAFDQNIFKKLRDLGFNDDEIEALTGVPDGGRIREGGKPAQYVPDGVGRRARTGLASESRAPGKLENDSFLRRVGRAVSEDGTTVLNSQILKDFLSGMSAEEVNEKHKLGGKRFANAAANREIGRIRSNMDSQANSDMDLLIYRASGLSVRDTADLFNISPREVRKRERRLGAKLKKNTDDEDLLYLRSALSLEETGKIVGLEPNDVRRQEQAALRKRRNDRGGLASASEGPDDDVSGYIEDQRILDGEALKIDEELADMDMGPRHEEIARRLGIPLSEVKERVQRADRRKNRQVINRRRGGLASESREMDMTLEEYAKLNDVLEKYMDDSQVSGIGADEDMQILQSIIDKIDDSSVANDAVSMTDSEIDDYIDTLTRMKDNGPVEDQGDKAEIEKLIDSLKKTKQSATGSYSSDALEEAGTRLSTPGATASRGARPARNVRAFRTSSGTINPHEKLRIELSRDEIGALRDEVEMLSRTAENAAPLRGLAKKLEKANNGKFTIEKDEYEDLIKSIEQSKSKGGVVSSDILGVLEQAAETSDGKFSSLNLRGGGLASANNGKRPNNGAPPDITEAMQKELIFWGKSANARNLRLVQEAIREYDANDGQLPPSMWKRLQTMYKNMGPGSGGGGRRGVTGRNSGAGRRARTGLASAGGEDAIGRDRGPTGRSVGSLGDIGVRADAEGSFGVGRGGGGMTGGGGGINQEKFEGVSFDEAKPGNWDDLTNDEKFEWLMYEGNPEKVADKDKRMSRAAHEGAVKKVLRDIEREEMSAMSPAERRAARDRDRDMPSENELERQRIAREKREKEKAKEKRPKTYKPAANAEEAKKKRAIDFETFKEWIEDSQVALDSLEEGQDYDPIAQDIWKTVDALLGEEDMTKRSIDDAISALEDYLEVASEDNKYEKKSVSRARNLLGQLEEAKAKYENDPWIVDDTPRAGLASRSRDGDRPRPGSREMPQSNAPRTGEMKKIIDLAQEVIDKMKSEQDSNKGRRARTGLASSSSRPKAMITDEATFFKDIENSLQKEIRAAQKANNKKAESGLSKLQEVIRRNEASKTGSRRTNVGSIYLTDDEADLVLEGLMFALDNQIEIGGDKRIEWYSKLLEKVSEAAMSTFINKNF